MKNIIRLIDDAQDLESWRLLMHSTRTERNALASSDPCFLLTCPAFPYICVTNVIQRWHLNIYGLSALLDCFQISWGSSTLNPIWFCQRKPFTTEATIKVVLGFWWCSHGLEILLPWTLIDDCAEKHPRLQAKKSPCWSNLGIPLVARIFMKMVRDWYYTLKLIFPQPSQVNIRCKMCWRQFLPYDNMRISKYCTRKKWGGKVYHFLCISGIPQ